MVFMSFDSANVHSAVASVGKNSTLITLNRYRFVNNKEMVKEDCDDLTGTRFSLWYLPHQVCVLISYHYFVLSTVRNMGKERKSYTDCTQ